MLALAWYSDTAPALQTVQNKESVVWTLKWQIDEERTGGVKIEPRQLVLSTQPTGVSFEHVCKQMEDELKDPYLGIACLCCSSGDRCDSCMYALGFHQCREGRFPDLDSQTQANKPYAWKAGSLFDGQCPGGPTVRTAPLSNRACRHPVLCNHGSMCRGSCSICTGYRICLIVASVCGLWYAG